MAKRMAVRWGSGGRATGIRRTAEWPRDPAEQQGACRETLAILLGYLSGMAASARSDSGAAIPSTTHGSHDDHANSLCLSAALLLDAAACAPRVWFA
jgi:hypothetical protein